MPNASIIPNTALLAPQMSAPNFANLALTAENINQNRAAGERANMALGLQAMGQRIRATQLGIAARQQQIENQIKAREAAINQVNFLLP